MQQKRSGSAIEGKEEKKAKKNEENGAKSEVPMVASKEGQIFNMAFPQFKPASATHEALFRGAPDQSKRGSPLRLNFAEHKPAIKFSQCDFVIGSKPKVVVPDLSRWVQYVESKEETNPKVLQQEMLRRLHIEGYEYINTNSLRNRSLDFAQVKDPKIARDAVYQSFLENYLLSRNRVFKRVNGDFSKPQFLCVFFDDDFDEKHGDIPFGLARALPKDCDDNIKAMFVRDYFKGLRSHKFCFLDCVDLQPFRVLSPLGEKEVNYLSSKKDWVSANTIVFKKNTLARKFMPLIFASFTFTPFGDCIPDGFAVPLNTKTVAQAVEAFTTSNRKTKKATKKAVKEAKAEETEADSDQEELPSLDFTPANSSKRPYLFAKTDNNGFSAVRPDQCTAFNGPADFSALTASNLSALQELANIGHQRPGAEAINCSVDVVDFLHSDHTWELIRKEVLKCAKTQVGKWRSEEEEGIVGTDARKALEAFRWYLQCCAVSPTQAHALAKAATVVGAGKKSVRESLALMQLGEFLFMQFCAPVDPVMSELKTLFNKEPETLYSRGFEAVPWKEMSTETADNPRRDFLRKLKALAYAYQGTNDPVLFWSEEAAEADDADMPLLQALAAQIVPADRQLVLKEQWPVERKGDEKLFEDLSLRENVVWSQLKDWIDLQWLMSKHFRLDSIIGVLADQLILDVNRPVKYNAYERMALIFTKLLKSKAPWVKSLKDSMKICSHPFVEVACKTLNKELL